VAHISFRIQIQMTVISRKLLFVRSRCLAGNIKVIAAMAEGI